jgi:hypothetical protein
MKIILFAVMTVVSSFLLSYIIDNYHHVPSAIIVCLAILIGYTYGSIGSFLEYQKEIKDIMNDLDKNE